MEKSIVVFFTAVRPDENHGQNDLFKEPFFVLIDESSCFGKKDN
jgi:hypothetical protein